MRSAAVVTCALITVYWLAITARVILAQRRIRWLVPLRSPAPSGARVSVVIPARNEEIGIAASLRSILAQEGVRLEVIVVNDHSSDRTGAIAAAIAREDDRVMVIDDPPLQPGWLGKPNALMHGAAAATGTHLLFSDADVVHAPTCLSTVLDVLVADNLDAVSCLPRWDNESFWENVNVPIYFFGAARLLGTRGLGDPASPAAVATGALILVKREVFDAVAGFEPVKGAMLDDVAFGRLLKDRGYRLGYRLAPECLHVRLFKTAREAMLGTTKNILSAAGRWIWLGLPLAIGGLVQHWLPVWAMADGAAQGHHVLAGAGLLAYLTQYLALFAGRRIVAFRPLLALFYPLAAVVAAVNIARAFWFHLRGSVYWREREVRLSRSS